MSTPDENTTTPATPHDVDLLSALQRGGRDEGHLRSMLSKELFNLAKVIEHDPTPNGMTYGAMGGIMYCLRQLQISFGSRDIDELEELYAKVELTSYPSSDDEMERTRKHYQQLGTIVVVEKCKFGTDLFRYRVVAPLAHTNGEGMAFQPLQLIHSIDREFPPLSEIAKDL